MKCSEFEQGLPEFLEQGGTNLQAHLNECATCAALVSDLKAISIQARSLQELDEPSARVWNAIEIELRREGLIRPQPAPRPAGFSLPSLIHRWGRAAWLVPAAAAVLVGAFLLGNPLHTGTRVLTVTHPVAPMSDEDQQLLSAVSARAPMMTADYKTGLDDVNAYIRDAQATADQNPNDEEAQRALMDAYEQKSMLYELALDHSLQ